MADAIIERLRSAEQRAREGARLRSWVRGRHLSSVGAHDIGVVLDELRAGWETDARA
jgi:hypothetical protein